MDIRIKQREKLKRLLPAQIMLANGSLSGGGGSQPSAFDDVWGWWDAGIYTGSSGSYRLTDQSPNGRDMLQQAGTLTPGTSANGLPRFVGNGTARLNAVSGSMQSWPVTVFTVGKRTTGQLCGLFGHSNATSYNSMWYGYEGGNSYSIYGTNRTNNVTADGGNTTCWLARIGHGSRVPFMNGLILNDMLLSNVQRSGAIGVSLGTQYRGLNLEWQETLVWNRLLHIDEIDEVHAYINAKYGLSVPLWSSYTAIDHAQIHGQSNAEGRGQRGTDDVNIPIEYRGLNDNVKFTNRRGSLAWDTTLPGDYVSMNLSTNTLFNANYIGPELTFGHDWAAKKGGQIWVETSCQGDTDLAYNASSANGYWHPIHPTAQNQTTSKFSMAMAQHWRLMRQHQIAGRRPVSKGIIWYQGESDAVISAEASAYSANGQVFFPALIDESGIGKTPKIFLVKIHADISIPPHTYRDTVRSQQDALAAILPNCTLMNVDAYPLLDSAHINYQGQLALGSQIAALI